MAVWEYELQPASDLLEGGDCSFCSLPAISPTQHDCGRLFCRDCVNGMEYQCDLCRKNPGKLSFCSPQIPQLNSLGEIKVNCSICSQLCVFSEFKDRKVSCDCITLVNCVGKPLGCSFSAPKKYLLSHERECERAKVLPILLPFTKKIAQLEKENTELRAKTSSLQHDNNTLQKENKTLKETATKFETETNKFKTETKTLQTQIIPLLKTETTNLKTDNKALQNIIKSNPIGSGVSFITLPFPEPNQPRKGVELLSGHYKLGAHFRKSKGGQGIEFSVSFQQGEFDEMIKGHFPFKGRVVLSLLSPSLQPFRVRVLDTEKNDVFKRFAMDFPSRSGVGCGEFATMEVVRKYLDGENKLWFSVKVERD